MSDDTYAYPFDPTGKASSNLVPPEQHVINPPEYTDFYYIVPKVGPFFEEGLVVTHYPSGVELTEGVDYVLGHKFASATKATGKGLWGSISFYDRTLSGVVEITYQTIGGMWTINEQKVTELLANTLINPRITTWEQVTELPVNFPVIDHEWNLDDMVGASDLVASINRVVAAILDGGEGGGGTGSHILDFGNPHGTNKEHVGLGHLSNFPFPENQSVLLDSSRSDRYVNLKNVHDIIALTIRNELNDHISAEGNVHGLTKSDLGLGYVENLPLSTIDDVLTADSNSSYMTPNLTYVLLYEHLGKYFEEHINAEGNVHNLTKSDLELGHVENLPLATNLDIIDLEGEKYVTVDALKVFFNHYVKDLSDFISDPDNFTKEAVGLGHVENLPKITELAPGTNNSTEHYTTPAYISARLVEFRNTLESSGIGGGTGGTADTLGGLTLDEIVELISGSFGQRLDYEVEVINNKILTEVQQLQYLINNIDIDTSNITATDSHKLNGLTLDEITAALELSFNATINSRIDQLNADISNELGLIVEIVNNIDINGGDAAKLNGKTLNEIIEDINSGVMLQLNDLGDNLGSELSEAIIRLENMINNINVDGGTGGTADTLGGLTLDEIVELISGSLSSSISDLENSVNENLNNMMLNVGVMFDNFTPEDSNKVGGKSLNEIMGDVDQKINDALLPVTESIGVNSGKIDDIEGELNAVKDTVSSLTDDVSVIKDTLDNLDLTGDFLTEDEIVDGFVELSNQLEDQSRSLAGLSVFNLVNFPLINLSMIDVIDMQLSSGNLYVLTDTELHIFNMTDLTTIGVYPLEVNDMTKLMVVGNIPLVTDDTITYTLHDEEWVSHPNLPGAPVGLVSLPGIIIIATELDLYYYMIADEVFNIDTGYFPEPIKSVGLVAGTIYFTSDSKLYLMHGVTQDLVEAYSLDLTNIKSAHTTGIASIILQTTSNVVHALEIDPNDYTASQVAELPLESGYNFTPFEYNVIYGTSDFKYSYQGIDFNRTFTTGSNIVKVNSTIEGIMVVLTETEILYNGVS